jgi:GNAT superfamily N-acetyltransferase
MLTLVRHNEWAAEVYATGVLPEFHRQGIGRALLGHAEGRSAAEGVELLHVKTLAPSKPDEGYDRTRAFHFANGFRLSGTVRVESVQTRARVPTKGHDHSARSVRSEGQPDGHQDAEDNHCRRSHGARDRIGATAEEPRGVQGQ